MYCNINVDGGAPTRTATTIDDLYRIGTTQMDPPIVVAHRGRKKTKRHESQIVVRRTNN
jgi:hypothetical protein